jgi:hypothetical protein
MPLEHPVEGWNASSLAASLAKATMLDTGSGQALPRRSNTREALPEDRCGFR